MFLAVGVGAYAAGDLPPDDPRLLQGAAVPRRGLGDPRACTTSRTCGSMGGLQQATCRSPSSTFIVGCAGDRRHPAARRLLLEGRDPLVGVPVDGHAASSGRSALVTGRRSTAFYMFRLMLMTFFGDARVPTAPTSRRTTVHDDRRHDGMPWRAGTVAGARLDPGRCARRRSRRPRRPAASAATRSSTSSSRFRARATHALGDAVFSAAAGRARRMRARR